MHILVIRNMNGTRPFRSKDATRVSWHRYERSKVLRTEQRASLKSAQHETRKHSCLLSNRRVGGLELYAVLNRTRNQLSRKISRNQIIKAQFSSRKLPLPVLKAAGGASLKKPEPFCVLGSSFLTSSSLTSSYSRTPLQKKYKKENIRCPKKVSKVKFPLNISPSSSKPLPALRQGSFLKA